MKNNSNYKDIPVEFTYCKNCNKNEAVAWTLDDLHVCDKCWLEIVPKTEPVGNLIAQKLRHHHQKAMDKAFMDYLPEDVQKKVKEHFDDKEEKSTT